MDSNIKRIIEYVDNDFYDFVDLNPCQMEARRITLNFFRIMHVYNKELFKTNTSSFETIYIINKSILSFSTYVEFLYLLSFENPSEREINVQKELQSILEGIKHDIIFICSRE